MGIMRKFLNQLSRSDLPLLDCLCDLQYSRGFRATEKREHPIPTSRHVFLAALHPALDVSPAT